MKTKTIIDYYAVDLTAKGDSSYSADNKQDFSNLNNLLLNKYSENNYSTLEKNFFILDGGKIHMGSSPNIAYWSKTMSDENGIFQNIPTLEITFINSVHSSIGLTLTFSEYSYCTEMIVTYYDNSNNQISTKTFYPDNSIYFADQVVTNYKKIVIQFKKTNYPYRYLKLYGVLFGKVVEFSGDNLVHANLLENANILSDQVGINTLEFTVYSDNDDFNILNPEGVYKTLQERQIITAYKVAEEETMDMGTFYLETWESENDNKMNFSAIDLIGILDKSEFLGGVYSLISFENLITSIMTSAGISSEFYEIDDELKNINLYGYIPICTHREALQQALFVVGALSNCSRSDKIKIYRAEESETPKIINNEKVFKATRKIVQGDIVTGVSVISHRYREGREEEALYDGVVDAGEHMITFDEPAHDIRCSGGDLIDSGANYAIIQTNSERNIVVYGIKYIHENQIYTVTDPDLVGNEKQNILKIESVYLINKANATNIATRVLNYYKNSYTTEFTFIQDDEKPSDNVQLEEKYGNVLDGYITQLDIDMTGGFVTKANVVAKVSEADE